MDFSELLDNGYDYHIEGELVEGFNGGGYLQDLQRVMNVRLRR